MVVARVVVKIGLGDRMLDIYSRDVLLVCHRTFLIRTFSQFCALLCVKENAVIIITSPPQKSFGKSASLPLTAEN